MKSQIIHKESYKTLPWKNGLSVTDEIFIYPSQATVVQDNFLWRLSSASIDEDSDFSIFPGIDRKLIILDGDVRLIQNDKAFDLKALSVFEFSGDVKTRCHLITGKVRDLNLMTRAKTAVSHVLVREIIQNESVSWNCLAQWNLVYLVSGQVEMVNKFLVGDTLLAEAGSFVTLTAKENTTIIIIEINQLASP